MLRRQKIVCGQLIGIKSVPNQGPELPPFNLIFILPIHQEPEEG
jgi:hypothetical protein